MSLVIVGCLLILITSTRCDGVETAEERHGVTYASKCEVCKVLADELEEQLIKTGKSSDVLEIGFNIDDDRKIKKIPYKKSEVRLMEVMDSACDNILQYNLHKERKDSTRFAKGMSQTFQTLHGLVDKGVKVELGIPYDLWDRPGAEVEHLKKQCDIMLEENEDSVTDWYFHHSEERLKDFLCHKILTSDHEKQCLHEKVTTDTKADTNSIPKNGLSRLPSEAVTKNTRQTTTNNKSGSIALLDVTLAVACAHALCNLINMSIEHQKADRQVLRPTAVLFNGNQLKTDQRKNNVKLCMKNDDVRFKGNDAVAQNACKKLNIPQQSKLYKNLINLESITLPAKCEKQRNRSSNGRRSKVDLEPKIDDFMLIEKHEYLLNPLNEINVEQKKGLQNTKLANVAKTQSKQFASRSRLIAKMQEWNSALN